MDSELTLGVSGWRLLGQRTGVARYALSILERLTPDVIDGRFRRITVYAPRQLGTAGIHLPGSVSERVLASNLPMLLWDNLYVARKATDDVVFYPSFSRPLVARGATVVTTHEAIMKIIPQMFDKRARFIYAPLYGWSARAATLVITTSQAAKRDIAKAWDIDIAKIRVTPLAAASPFEPLPQSVDRAALRAKMFGDDAPYFLFVGKVSGRRNIPELLRGYQAFKRSTGLSHRLVIAGPDYAVQAAQRVADEMRLGADLITRSYVPDEDLNAIYNCADALVMPSVYENGSLPVFEAQAAGTPVISVDTDGTREITGGAALLIPSLSSKEIADALTTVASDATLRSTLSTRGLANARQYSWERCARETTAVCYEAAQTHRS
jgi:glycosyltransferase involved in cell wall biosynthesis